MRRINRPYIHLHSNWPRFTWNSEVLLPQLAALRHQQGQLHGYLELAGYSTRSDTTLHTLTSEALKTSEIEGLVLNPDQVRSSVARQLRLNTANLVNSSREVDGVVNMLLDATQRYKKPLTSKRLFRWHSSLFNGVKQGAGSLSIGQWRNKALGPIQVVSGAMGKEKVHFEAPEAKRLKKEMQSFLTWFNSDYETDPVLKSGVAHLWFLTLHPFDDGNGRIARALSDLQLSRADNDARRFYSMSTQIRMDRKSYYEVLESTQKGDLNITVWLQWYLGSMQRALQAASKRLQNVHRKNKFWTEHHNTELNERQRRMINKLFDGIEGKLNTSKWAKMSKCSTDTALRDIHDLLQKKILKKEEAGGRSTHYELLH